MGSPAEARLSQSNMHGGLPLVGLSIYTHMLLGVHTHLNVKTWHQR